MRRHVLRASKHPQAPVIALAAVLWGLAAFVARFDRPAEPYFSRVRVVFEHEKVAAPSVELPARWFALEPAPPSELDRYCCIRERFAGLRRAALLRDPARMASHRREAATSRAFELDFCCKQRPSQSEPGEVTVRLRIDALGDVASMQVHVDPQPELALGACATRVASSWRFLRGRESSDAEVKLACGR